MSEAGPLVGKMHAERSTATFPGPAGAGVGGASAGTGLVAIAQSVGPSTTLGAILLYATPAASFLVALTLYFVQVQVSRYFERRLINNARKTLEQQLDNPRTSPRHKAKIRLMLEELEKYVASEHLKRVRQIGMMQPERQYEQP